MPIRITGGFLRGRNIESPDSMKTRPTASRTREALFNILQGVDGFRMLDLFAGSGIMGLEALSRGFKSVTVIEKNKQSAKIIKSNYNKLGLEPNLYICDSLSFLSKNDEFFDVVYIDPPYNSNLYETSINLVQQQVYFH